MRESRTYGSVRGARDETRVPTATSARVIRLIFKPVKSALLASKVANGFRFAILDSSSVRDSLDHLVGEREHRRRYIETQRSGRPEVDGELDLGRLLDR